MRDFATGASAEVLSDENRFGRYVKFHATNWALLKELVTAGDLVSADGDGRHTGEAGGVPFGVVLVPLRNAAGRPLGVIAVAKDFSGSRGAMRQSLVWQALLSLFGIVLLSGVVLVAVRGLMLRPLGVLEERFAALAAKEPGVSLEPMEDVDTLCAEMQALAGHYERLRAERGSMTAAAPSAAGASVGKERGS